MTVALVRRPLEGGAFTPKARAESVPAVVMGFNSLDFSIR